MLTCPVKRILYPVVAIFVSVWMGLITPAQAEDTASVDSPDHNLSVTVSIDSDGRVAYEVKRGGKSVISPSRLGFILTNAPKLDRHFAIERTQTATHDETWEQPWGERRFIRDHYNELRVTLVQKAFDNRHMTVVFRVFDDGVGFRYEFPDQPQLKTLKIADELTEFAVTDKATAWWDVAGEWNLSLIHI